MKIWITTIGLIFMGLVGFSQNKVDLTTTTFGVRGNCGMCKKTIESAAKKVEGVEKASWDSKSLTLTVSYADWKTNESEIHKAVAASGYDTDQIQASSEAYSSLPGCCQYNRKSKFKSKKKEGHSHEHHGDHHH